MTLLKRVFRPVCCKKFKLIMIYTIMRKCKHVNLESIQFFLTYLKFELNKFNQFEVSNYNDWLQQTRL